jgi:glycosyltransferase involved in cell wall biosynthesis
MQSKEKKKIILAVINDLLTDQRVHKMALTLAQCGWKVALVGRLKKDSTQLPPRPYPTYRLNLFFEKGKLFYLEFTVRLFFFLLFRKFDIVTANDLDTLLPCYLAAQIKRKELIYDTHEYFTEVPELVKKSFEKSIWLTLEKWLFPKVKKIITVNEKIASEYSRKYNKNITVIKNMPFLQKVTPDISQKIKKKILLYQGAVNLGRGVDLMLQTITLLPEFKLWIIGKGDIYEDMKELARQIGALNQVVFWGNLPFEQLPQYTQMAFLGFSLEENIGLNYRYATPNKIYDYIQSRTPVIVSDLPEMKRIVAVYKVGRVLTERTPKALASLILELYQAPSRYYQLIENTNVAAEILCWEKQENILKQLYQD